jgi:nucleotide-binding universal stress UspA family protein
VREFKRILCPIDLSDASARTLAYADAVARWYQGHVTVFHAAPALTPVAVPAGGIFQPLQVTPVHRDELMQQLQQMVTAAGMNGPDVTEVVEEGEAATAIVEHARQMHADLVVMGTHGRRGFDRLLLGSVTERVLRKAPCPVLTVPPHAPATPAPPAVLKQILCAIDFSPASIASLRHAIDIGRRAGSSILLVHSIESLAEEEPREIAHYSVPEFRRYLIEDGRQRLAELVSNETSDGPNVTAIVVAGRAYREILRIADEKKPDLIVMGAQGRGGAALALFGSTTQEVVRGGGCPVLTVR